MAHCGNAALTVTHSPGDCNAFRAPAALQIMLQKACREGYPSAQDRTGRRPASMPSFQSARAGARQKAPDAADRIPGHDMACRIRQRFWQGMTKGLPCLRGRKSRCRILARARPAWKRLQEQKTGCSYSLRSAEKNRAAGSDAGIVPDRAGSGPDTHAAAAFVGERRPMNGKMLRKGQKAMLMA